MLFVGKLKKLIKRW